MGYFEEILAYAPCCTQEEIDKQTILAFIRQFPHNALLRENTLAHLTASGFVMNPQLDKALLVHHNQRGVWSWSGGHADGDADLLGVALREAMEESGLQEVQPLFPEIASLDVLPVASHWKRGAFIGAHLHLSVAYILIADERQALQSCAGENTAVAWFPVAYFTDRHFSAQDTLLYQKLIARARDFAQAD